LHPGTRHAYCLNSDLYWNFSRNIVTRSGQAVGDHPALMAWQIDNGIGGHGTEFSFNDETEHDWHLWLKAKYGTVDRLNELMGLRFWSQTVTDWSQVPMPKVAPTVHNPALMLDWMRFSSDSCVAFVRMQRDLLHRTDARASRSPPTCARCRGTSIISTWRTRWISWPWTASRR
jgi:beta-galactosidase